MMLTRKKPAALVIFLFLFLVACSVIPDQKQAAEDELVLGDSPGQYSLGPHLDVLEDPAGQLTIEQVSSPQMSAAFVPSVEETLTYGVTRSAIWTRLRIVDQNQSVPYWLLEVRNATLENVDLYLPGADGGYMLHPSGLLVPDKEQEFPDNHYVFQIPAGIKSGQALYLRFATTNSMTIPAAIWSASAFDRMERNEELLWGAYYGILLVMAIYNGLIFISLRDRDYLFLVIYILAVLLQTAFIDGRIKDILPAGLGSQYRYLYPLFAIPNLPALLLFSTSFLKIKEYAPRLYRVTLGLFVVLAILTLSVFFIDRYLVSRLFLVVSLPVIAVAILSGLTAWRKGYRPARYFLLAMLVPLLLGIGEPLSRLGLLPTIPELYSTLHLGDLILVTILSLALADRINYYRSQTESALAEVRHREQLITEYLDALPIGVAVYGSDANPAFINRVALDIFHLQHYDPQKTLETLLQTSNVFSTGSKSPVSVQELPVARALQGQVSYRDDLEIEVDCRRLPLEIVARPIHASDGSIQYAIAAFQDISLRKEQETAVRLARELYQSVVEKEVLLISRFTKGGTLTFANRAYADYFGLSQNGLLGTNVLAVIDEADRAYAEGDLAKMRPENPVRLIELRVIDRQQQVRWLRWTIQGFFDDQGNLVEYQATGEDITSQKIIEEQLDNYRENLEKLVAERTSQERRQRAIAESLQVSASILSSDLNLDNVLAKILEQLPQVIPVDRAGIYLREGQDLLLSTCTERSQSAPGEKIPLSLDWSPLVKVFLGRKSLSVADTQSDPGWDRGETTKSVRSWMGTPLLNAEAVIGVLSVSSATPHLYDEAALPILEAFASHAAIAITNARLFQESRQAATLEERNRLARDLHDAVMQTLFSASIITQALPLQWEQDEPGARANLQRLHQLTTGALAEMRLLLLELRPDSLTQTPLSTLLKNLCEAYQAASNVKVILQSSELQPSTRPVDMLVPAHVKEVLYRVTQEALNNVSKHARAGQVEILLQQSSGGISLGIKDDGTGFDPASIPSGHLGLQMMRERAQAIEAELTIESHPSRGTSIRVDWKRIT